MYITKIDQHGLTEVFATNSNGKPVCSADEKSHTPGKRDCRKKLRTRHDQQMQFCHSIMTLRARKPFRKPQAILFLRNILSDTHNFFCNSFLFLKKIIYLQTINIRKIQT